MKLQEFPRPKFNNGVGMHLGLTLTKRNIYADLARCKELGVTWVTVCHSDPDIVVEAAKIFWEEGGIMPILQPRWQLEKEPPGWERFTRKAVDALPFRPYIQLYSEPSADREWGMKKPDDWLDWFVDEWRIAANQVAADGALPGLQVLGLDELEAVLSAGWHKEGWFCPHNYGLNHPPHYEEDINGVLGFLQFAKMFQEIIGYVPPMIGGEGGWQYGSEQDDIFPKVDDQLHAEYHLELFGSFKSGILPGGWALPDYLFAVCAWILSGQEADTWYGGALGTKRATVEAITGLTASGWERKFSWDELAPAEEPSMEEEMRELGIDIIDRVPWGTHLCLFYQSKEELIDVMVPYFKVGLENNEFCMWVASEPVQAEAAKSALRSVIEDLDDYIEKGQIEILDHNQWYTKSGRFEADEVLQGWIEKEDHALKKGFDGLRLAGNTLWLEKDDWAEFADYEATLDGVIPKHRMIAVCTYSLDKCGASEVVDVVSNHLFALTRREGRWVDLDRIRKMVRVIVTTRPDEIGCDECFEQLDRFVEIRLAGKEIPEAMLLVQDHLERCDDCHEEFEALLAAMGAPL